MDYLKKSTRSRPIFIEKKVCIKAAKNKTADVFTRTWIFIAGLVYLLRSVLVYIADKEISKPNRGLKLQRLLFTE